MAEKKVPTAKFVVIKNNTLGHKVGDIISLTKAKSVSLVGKVRLVKDMEAAKRSAEAITEVKAELAEALAANEALTLKVEELTAELAAK